MKNKRIFITGGTSGIGAALTKQLYKENEVIICGRNEAKIEEVQAHFKGVEVVKADISKEADQVALARYISAQFEGLDLLINNAGIAHFPSSNETLGARQFAEMDINFKATIMITHQLMPLLINGQQPGVVFVSSILAKVPSYDLPIYSASKAALHSYCQSFRAKHPDLHVTEVLPPLVDTPMTKEVNEPKMNPERVASDIISGVGNGKTTIYPGIARAANLMSRWWPEKISQIINK